MSTAFENYLANQSTQLGSDETFLEAVLRGLRTQPKRLPCKFLYDTQGSRLFEQICAVEEYYPTRTERQILEQHIDAITATCGSNCLLVELGSGSSTKTRLLLDHLQDPAAYVPIDIAREQLLRTACNLREEYPALEVLPLCRDYFSMFQLPVPARRPARTIVFFPGSTIGNLEPADVQLFLRKLRRWTCPGGGLLLGVDLQKPRQVLEAAYNDARGATAAFNLNLLRRMNRELNADFDPQRFRHRAIYNPQQKRIEMHLISQERQVVHLDGQEISFRPGESIVTEHSYKYSVGEFRMVAHSAGLTVQSLWCDSRNWFGLFFLA